MRRSQNQTVTRTVSSDAFRHSARQPHCVNTGSDRTTTCETATLSHIQRQEQHPNTRCGQCWQRQRAPTPRAPRARGATRADRTADRRAHGAARSLRVQSESPTESFYSLRMHSRSASVGLHRLVRDSLECRSNTTTLTTELTSTTAGHPPPRCGLLLFGGDRDAHAQLSQVVVFRAALACQRHGKHAPDTGEAP